MSKSKRKAEQRIIKDRYRGTPLTQDEWIAETKRVEETDYRKTALKDGLLSWMRDKGILVVSILLFPPLAVFAFN